MSQSARGQKPMSTPLECPECGDFAIHDGTSCDSCDWSGQCFSVKFDTPEQKRAFYAMLGRAHDVNA